MNSIYDEIKTAAELVSYVSVHGLSTKDEEIRRDAWGFIEYSQPLDANEAADYELVEAGSTGRVVQAEYYDGTPLAYIEN